MGRFAALAMVLGLGFQAGCDRDVRLAGRKLRDVQVRTVSYYGMTLDPPASPVKVAYVLLRAIRDDFLAADDSEREAALDIQFDVCAADAIQARNDIGLSRAEALYNVVYRWTPTVAHYVNEFDTEWTKAQARLVQMGPRPAAAGAAQECQVVLELTDPDGDPNAGALLYVWLIKDSDYWRVLRMGFFAKQRSLTARQSTPTELPEPKPSSDSR